MEQNQESGDAVLPYSAEEVKTSLIALGYQIDSVVEFGTTYRVVVSRGTIAALELRRHSPAWGQSYSHIPIDDTLAAIYVDGRDMLVVPRRVLVVTLFKLNPGDFATIITEKGGDYRYYNGLVIGHDAVEVILHDTVDNVPYVFDADSPIIRVEYYPEG